MTTSLRTAMIQMLSARLASIVLMVVFFATLARLLDPADFGYFAIAMSAYTLMKTITAFGLQEYVIRAREDVDRESLGRAAGLSLMIALGGCTLFLGTAAFLGGWLMPAPLALALVPMAVALLLEPFSLAIDAQLRRRLSFRLPAQIATLRTAADGGTAIALALLGWGAPALAMGVLASQIVATGMLLALGGAERRVRPRLSLSVQAGFGNFGRNLTMIRIAPNFTDLMLVSGLGAIAGPVATGLFDRAQIIHRTLDRTLFEGIAPVVLPAISTALAAGTERKQVYVTKIEMLFAICWPGYAMIALMADPLVDVMLGDGWEEAVLPIRILAAMGLFLPISQMSLGFFTAIDELPFYLRMQLRSQIVRLVLGLAGAAISLEAFCAAIVAGSAFKAGYLCLWTRRHFGSGHYRGVLSRALLISIATLCGPAALLWLGDLSPVVTLAASLLLAGLSWLAAIRVFRHPLWFHVAETANNLLRRGGNRQSRP